MIFYYILAAILIYFSYKSLRGGMDYLSFFKTELAKPRSDFAPFCSIIAPCKGLDVGLELNLNALLTQEFPNYEVIFVLDSEDDPAAAIIKKLIASNPRSNVSTSLVIAGSAENEAQKIHNLREAVLRVADRSEIFVFVDSDARPCRDWLRSLVAPLENKTVGCASGYRWFIGKKLSIPTELRSAWNASVASQLGRNVKSNFCWGGSTSISRKLFNQLAICDQWRGTLSDDYVITRAVQESNLAIYHVPQCLTATIENCTFAELLEFTTRQMKITRVYAPRLSAMSLIGSGLFCLVMLASILLMVLSENFWIPLATIGAVSVFSVGKSWLRLKAIKLVLPEYKQQLGKQAVWQYTLWALAPFIFFYNGICALISRRILWRGIRYELKSPKETVIISAK